MIDPAAITHEVRLGDSRELLREVPDACIDALVTDPPAGISFMGKEWDHDHGGREGWCRAFAAIFSECLRVLKPGAYGVVWALPRTSHWTATALEDAGFEIRDVVIHLFGTGFPKSLDVSKAIDKANGAERPITGTKLGLPRYHLHPHDGGEAFGAGLSSTTTEQRAAAATVTGPATPEAARWQGWGTALKPAAEHWILVRKPLAGTVAENVLAHGTGGLNVDGCRIGTIVETWPKSRSYAPGQIQPGGRGHTQPTGVSPAGRWPANVTLDEEAAAMLDAQSGDTGASAPVRGTEESETGQNGIYGRFARVAGPFHGDSGGASRFFYVAKPDRAERDEGITSSLKTGGEATDRVDGSDGLKSPRAGAGRNGGARNHHPTVKAVSLMRWLVRLVTPPGGLLLDPFAGSGSTGIAAFEEDKRFLGFEREPEYHRLAVERIAKAREQMRLPWAEGT